MEIAKEAKVHHLCMPNAVLTFKEYLLDYASPEMRALGETLIADEVKKIPESMRGMIEEYLRRLDAGERDLYV